MNQTRRVGTMGAAVGQEFGFRDEEGDRHRVRVLAIETAHILVEYPDIPEAGTGRRRWMSHDAFALATRGAQFSPASPDPLAGALAPQLTHYDEGGLRLYVTRREARVDVSFRSLDRDGTPRFLNMDPPWLLTALETVRGLRLLEQNPGPGEEAALMLPGLARHLAAHPLVPMPGAADVRYLRVCGFVLRARRMTRGRVEPIRVDCRVDWKDGLDSSWAHGFDGVLVHGIGGGASLRIDHTSMMFAPSWGQVEHLARFAIYAAFVTTASAEVVLRPLPDRIVWGHDEAALALIEAP